jgi:hypothetical protein
MTRRVYFREIYFYLICLAAIIIFIVGLVMAYDGTISYIKPTTYMTKPSVASMYSKEQYPNLSSSEIDKLVNEEINANLQNEKDLAFKNLLRGVLLVIISIPLFAFHWRKAQQMWVLSLETRDSE